MEFPISQDYFILKEGDERIKYRVYYYDTETHADRELQASILTDIEKGKRPKTEDAGIWLACTINAESTPESNVFDVSMAQVLKRWENMAENENCLIYCFNLSFEWSYLRPYIYKIMRQVDGELSENSFSIVSNVSQSVVYQIKMRFSGKVIKIVDLHRLITGASLGKLAQELKLDVQKGNLDKDEGGVDSYDKMRRLPNYQPTNNEKVYCFRDCWVMKEIIDLKIKEYQSFVEANPWQWGHIENKKAVKVPTIETEEGKEFFNSVTTASYSCKVMIRETYPRKVIQTKKGEKILTSLSQFRDNYPVLDPEVEKFVRYSYEGGLCFPTFKYGGACSLGRFYHVDVNSQYPSQIDQHPLPYGRPKHFKGNPPKAPGYMYLMKIRYKYKELKFIPSLQMTGKPLIWLQKNVNKMIGEEYSNEPVDCDVLYVWDFYIDALKACLVGFDYEVVEGYAFKSKIADFAPYFREHFELKNKYKKEHLDGLKMTEKLLINSPTGKLGEKARNYRLKLEPDEEGWLFNTKEEINEGDKGYRKSAKFTYTPCISAITAWARRFLILTAQRFGFENIAYCDTDSLFVLATPETTKLLEDKYLFGKNLMQWDRDLDYLSPTFSKAKNYCGVLDCDDAKLDVKSGGVSEPEPLLSPLMSGLDEETPLKTKSRQMVNTKNGKVMVALTRELSCSVVCYLNKFKTIDYRAQQRACGLWSDEDDRKVEKALEKAYKEANKKGNEKTEFVDVTNVYEILRSRMLGV